MAEGTRTIYVSGNPELYPIEYYDSGDERYDGAIPEILEDFAEEYGYDVIYYEADGKDHRQQHFKNIQVDIISGVGGDFSPDGETIAIFKTEQGGKTISYGLTFTDAAPEKFKENLTEYFEGISDSEKTGLLIDITSAGRETKPLTKSVIGIFAVFFAAVCILGVLLFRLRKQLQQTEARLSLDSSTGLGNREYLEKYYSRIINENNRVMYAANYFYVDTERLARLGGHKEAERAMRYAGEVLNEYMSQQDILVRISQDGLVLFKLTGKNRENDEWISIAIEKIRAYSEKHGKPYSINAWAGIYPLRQSDRDLEPIIAYARQTACVARQENMDFSICSDKLLLKFQEERFIEGDIERAFENGEFQMYLQFYVEAQSGKVCGAEALTRWLHPAKGLLPPGAFIHILEKTGGISRLDYLMLEHACAFLERNADKKESGFFLSCNFSRISFMDMNFVEKCKAIIDKYTFDRSRLTFELTESPDAGDAEQIKKNAAQLKAYGISLALDDFGEGFTSVKDLLNYPIDIVKLDKSLTDSIKGEKGKKILKALISAWHEMSVKCLAEGVEDEEVLRVLKEVSCDVVQGYMFYYPLPEREAEV